MNELTDLTTKLISADRIELTAASAGFFYCRFFLGGVYMDRLRVSDPAIIEQLNFLRGKGDEIGAAGIARLRGICEEALV